MVSRERPNRTWVWPTRPIATSPQIFVGVATELSDEMIEVTRFVTPEDRTQKDSSVTLFLSRWEARLLSRQLQACLDATSVKSCGTTHNGWTMDDDYAQYATRGGAGHYLAESGGVSAR